MLRPEINIYIEFNKNSTYPDRSGNMQFGYVNSLEVDSSWKQLGDTCKFKLPRGTGNGVSTIYTTGQVQSTTSSSTPATGQVLDYSKGGITEVPLDENGNIVKGAYPLLMKGDRIVVSAGYRYYPNAQITGAGVAATLGLPSQNTQEILTTNIIFEGWVTKVTNRVPIEVECMDDCWQLQQFTPANKTYPASTTVEDMVQDMLWQYNQQLVGLQYPLYYKPAPDTVTSTTNSTFQTNGETFAQILKRLRTTCFFESYFRRTSNVVTPQPVQSTLTADQMGFQMGLDLAADNPTNQGGTQIALHSSIIQYYPGSYGWTQGTAATSTTPYIPPQLVQVADGTPEESSTSTLVFQRNIISDDLHYTRIDDVAMGCVAYSYVTSAKSGSKTGLNGKKPTKKIRYEVFVGFDGSGRTPGADKNGYYSKVYDTLVSPQDANNKLLGEFFTYYFDNVATTDELIGKATAQLRKAAYAGWRGTLTTFGLPKISHGDQVVIQDQVLPERSGIYFVRGVTTTYGLDGFRQKVDLDLRIDGQTGIPKPWVLPTKPTTGDK